MKCKLADFNIEIKEKHEILYEYFKNHLADFDVPDCSLEITEEEICAETVGEELGFADAYLEAMAIFRRLAEWLPTKNGFVLHSACFEIDGNGIAFAAHSGTGKTTHMCRWMEYLGDKFVVVNGDKPIIRFFDNEPNIPYAYGTPWKGKERMGSNIRTPLKHICFIERAQSNYVERVKKEDVVDRIFNQVYMPQNNPMAVVSTMQLIDKLLNSCNLWIIHCNMDDNAGEIAYKAIFSDSK